MSVKIMVKISDKNGNLRGYLTPEQIKNHYGIPATSQRFLPDILKDLSEKSSECNFAVDLC